MTSIVSSQQRWNTPTTPVRPIPLTRSRVNLNGMTSGVGKVRPCSKATPIFENKLRIEGRRKRRRERRREMGGGGQREEERNERRDKGKERERERERENRSTKHYQGLCESVQLIACQ